MVTTIPQSCNLSLTFSKKVGVLQVLVAICFFAEEALFNKRLLFYCFNWQVEWQPDHIFTPRISNDEAIQSKIIWAFLSHG